MGTYGVWSPSCQTDPAARGDVGWAASPEALVMLGRDLHALIFDVDGTLYHQKALRRRMLLRLLREYAGKPRLGITVIRALSIYRRAQEFLRNEPVEGDLATSHLAISSQRSGLPPHQIEGFVARWMEVEPLSLLRGLVLPDLPELLSAARERGIRIAAVSDYPATAKLEAMGLSGFFEVVVAAQDAGINRFKPHPMGLVEALRRLGVDRSAALYVGDRDDIDGEAARMAGVRCVIVNSSCSNAGTCGGTHVAGYIELHSMLFSARDGQLS